jgi:beta-lactamase superfamily II metal-dependent hydrolase
MSTTLHFIDVGQGNMTLIKAHSGKVILYDCNVTEQNEDRVLGYLTSVLGRNSSIDIFINSHRDADHMRGIKKIHRRHPIQRVWDTGVTGTTPDSSEYRDYMELRRSAGYFEPKARTYLDYDYTRLRVLNAQDEALIKDPNVQSIVIKVCEMSSSKDRELYSVMLAGDSDAAAWKQIRSHYRADDLKCNILLASHHGSLSYFDDPADTHYYLDHLAEKSPHVTIISTGPNSHGHPDKKALEFYERHSSGCSNGLKILRTDLNGTIRAEIDNAGNCNLTWQL